MQPGGLLNWRQPAGRPMCHAAVPVGRGSAWQLMHGTHHTWDELQMAQSFKHLSCRQLVPEGGSQTLRRCQGVLPWQCGLCRSVLPGQPLSKDWELTRQPAQPVCRTASKLCFSPSCEQEQAASFLTPRWLQPPPGVHPTPATVAAAPKLAASEPPSGCRRRARSTAGKKSKKGEAGKGAAAAAAEQGGDSSSGEGNQQRASWHSQTACDAMLAQPFAFEPGSLGVLLSMDGDQLHI